MDSVSRIMVDVDLGRKGIEKTEMYVYLDGKLIETHFDKSYDDINVVVQNLRGRYKDVLVEVACEGEDFFGRIHRWPLEI
jgi:hypothetical protein